MNKVILLGNLTRDIEVKFTQNGLAVGTCGIATNRRTKTQSGETRDEVMFVDITFFGRTAEIANQYFRKGSKILVEGRLSLDSWVDQSGMKRSKHSVKVETLEFVESKGSSSSDNGNNNNGNGNGGNYGNSGGNYSGGNSGYGQNNDNSRNYNNQPKPSYNNRNTNASQKEPSVPVIDIDDIDMDDQVPF
jgi:single-strand DNA-binding protein